MSIDVAKRTGIMEDDIDEWLEKTEAVRQTISGIANGTLDPKNASLKEYGILTIEEQTEEEERKKRAKEEVDRRQRENDAAKKIKEREKWWEGALMMYGPKDNVGMKSSFINNMDEVS